MLCVQLLSVACLLVQVLLWYCSLSVSYGSVHAGKTLPLGVQDEVCACKAWLMYNILTLSCSSCTERHQSSSQDTKIRDMMNKLGSDVCCWELFATELGMEPGNIERIKRKERGDDRLCFMRMLEEWRANPPPEYSFTMQSVVTILRKPPISLNRLANQIEHGNH